MKILKRSTCVLEYSIKPELFHDQIRIFKSWGTSSVLQKTSNDTYRCQFEISFVVIDENSDKNLINFRGRLEFYCKFSNVQADAIKVISLKENAHNSMRNFLEKTTKSIFKSLGSLETDFFCLSGDLELYKGSHILDNEIKNIKRALGTLTFEEMSEDEQILMKTLS